MKMIIANIEGILKHQKEPSKSASSKVGASAKPKPTSNCKRQKMRDAMKDEKMFVPYHELIEMSEVGNRREGGRFVFQDFRVDEKGPWTKQDLEYLINRATSRSIDDVLPEISDIWDPSTKTDSINEGHSGYKKVIIPIESEEYKNMDDFELGILPLKESKFAHSDWNAFLGPPRALRHTKLNPEEKAGRRLGAKLRHGLGKARVPRGVSDSTPCEGLKCDEGYWVNLRLICSSMDISGSHLDYNTTTEQPADRMSWKCSTESLASSCCAIRTRWISGIVSVITSWGSRSEFRSWSRNRFSWPDMQSILPANDGEIPTRTAMFGSCR